MPGTTFLPKAGTLGTAIGLSIGADHDHYRIKLRLHDTEISLAGGTFTKIRFGRTPSMRMVSGGLSYLSIVPLNATALGLVSQAFGRLVGGRIPLLGGRLGYLCQGDRSRFFALILFALLSSRESRGGLASDGHGSVPGGLCLHPVHRRVFESAGGNFNLQPLSEERVRGRR